jgi:hypothetical protein
MFPDTRQPAFWPNGLEVAPNVLAGPRLEATSLHLRSQSATPFETRGVFRTTRFESCINAAEVSRHKLGNLQKLAQWTINAGRVNATGPVG